MLKRAQHSLALAVVPATLVYTQAIDVLMPFSRFLFFVLLGFSIVSFLFAMFEDEQVAEPKEAPIVAPRPQRAPLALAKPGILAEPYQCS